MRAKLLPSRLERILRLCGSAGASRSGVCYPIVLRFPRENEGEDHGEDDFQGIRQ